VMSRPQLAALTLTKPSSRHSMIASSHPGNAWPGVT
jgi:hypothetical protein